MPNFAASRLVTGPFDEAVIRDAAVQLREQLSGRPTFGLVFVTPDYADKADDLLEIVRVYGHVPTLIGCSGTGLVGSSREQEEGPGFSMLFVSLPGGKAKSIAFTQDIVEASNGASDCKGVARFPESLFAERRDLAQAVEPGVSPHPRLRRDGGGLPRRSGGVDILR
jgi:small ligand-binding sensory domain FIST